MDPHSRLSQFNHRVTKAGPQSRNIEPIPPPKDSFKMPSRKPTKAVVRRPIATNSRVKQTENFKRDMYLSFVSNALQQKTNGSSDDFDELVGQFTTFSSNPNSSNKQPPQQVDAAQIRLWIVALSHVVSRLERIHASLVHAIVNMPWTTLDNATVKSYTVFTGMLLSARPEYLSIVLAKIAQGFTYQSGLQALDTSLPESSIAPVTRRLIYDRLHYLLRHILSLIPTLPSTLQAFLIRHFPHKRQNQVAQTTYIRNLLKVSSYCPELADKILAIIVDRAIQMDVEIQIELEELEEDEGVEDHDIFELDPFDVVVGQEGDSLSDSEDSDENGDDEDNFSDLSSDFGDMDGQGDHAEVPTNIKHIQSMVNKLDAILTLVFEHFQRTYESVSASSSSVDSRPLSPLELLPLPPLSPATPSLPSPLASFGPSPIPLTPTAPTAPAVTSSPIPESQQTTRAPTPHTEQYLRVQFQALLSIFDRIILRTFKSRYTQFLIFWYTSLDPEFADIFQGMLVDRALLGGADPHYYGGSTTTKDGDESAMVNSYMITPELTRAAAASYIGSFVSRATFVDREGARRVVGVLCEFLNAHLESVEQALRGGWFTSGVSAQGQHTVFYAVAQAVFLIFCFRWRDLMNDDMGDDDDEPKLYLDSNGMIGGRVRKPINSSKDKWMPELGILKRVVVSVLNPLKVCSRNVVMQFARVAHATDFIYCYTILETNKRSEHGSFTSRSVTTPPRHRQSDGSTTTTKINPSVFVLPVNAEIHTFFPFDPYRLPKSNAFIQGVYREWSSVAIEVEDDDEDEEEEDELDDELDKEERGELEDGTSSRYLNIPRDKENDGGLGESLGAMSISPL